MHRFIRTLGILAAACVLAPIQSGAQYAATENLVVATIAGDLDRVQQLLDDGSRIEQRLGGHTALTAAIAHEHLEIVYFLLEQGADPNATCCGSPSNSPLTLAVSGGHTELVRDLINRGADLEPVVGGEPPLMTAVRRGDLQTARELIAAGVDLDAVHDGSSALSIADRNNRIEFVLLLLEAGADPATPCCGGSGTMLYTAARQRDVEQVRLLIESGVNLDAASFGGTTPLVGTIGSSLEIAHMLIDAGADVTLATDRGVTALSKAVSLPESSGVPLVRALLERGADVNFLYCAGWEDDSPQMLPQQTVMPRHRAARATALTVAAGLGNNWAVEMLIDAGADAGLARCDGQTPLALARDNGYESAAAIVRAALNGGTDP